MVEKLNILKELRVLYMEDQEELRNTVVNVLKNIFNDIVVAVDGKNGVELYNKYNDSGKHIDIILSDINMPNLNGIEACKSIVKINSDIPIVLLTGHNDSNYLLEAINLGISQYILKPIESFNLIDKLYNAYLPVYHSKQLEQKCSNLEELNHKIIKTSKEEAKKFIFDDDDYLCFGELIDNINLDS